LINRGKYGRENAGNSSGNRNAGSTEKVDLREKI